MKHFPMAPLVSSVIALLAGPAIAADPTVAQCLAASDASIELDNRHKLRAERAQLLLCAASSCPTDIRHECLRRIEEVGEEIPTVMFEAKDAAGHDLSAVKVMMDGELLVGSLDGTSLPVDPGEHVFTFETSGAALVRQSLVIRQGQRDRRERIAFGPPTVALPPQVGTAADVPSSAPHTGMGSRKIAGAVAGGIGVIGLGVGTAFGLLAKSRRDDARAVCPDLCSDVGGQEAWSSAQTAGNFSTAMFIVGAAGVAGGAILWLTARPETTSAPTAQVGAALGRVEVSVRW